MARLMYMKPSELKETRLRLGLTQAELSKKLGYNRSRTITDKEAGRRGITKQDEIILKSLKPG